MADEHDQRVGEIVIAIVRVERERPDEREPNSDERFLDELADARRREQAAAKERDYRNRN